MDGVIVEEAQAAAIRPVRTAVLRPHFEPGRLLELPEDEQPRTRHLAARDVSGEVIGCVTFIPRACPVPEREEAGVQLRGMAVLASWQRRGVGRALILGARDLLFGEGGAYVGEVVWCNARQSAEPFYEGLGFEGVGARFEIEGIGPHRVMIWSPRRGQP